MSKKKIILETALELFSRNGYSTTSTAKIAKTAGVSEGLIFKHYENKNGLLEAILELGKEKGEALFNEIEKFTEPKEQLKAILSIPLNIPNNDHAFWKLVYALKWQADEYDQTMYIQIKQLVINIFKELEYAHPELEAEFILMIIDGIASSILLKGVKQKEEIANIIFEKYQLS
ncbi:MAG: helix-turn-helix transcriptional regulator [Flavobacteriales bacterium]|nr:helix-turn-helix transcriptional regulator [Flavobacteriales bacterium]